MSFQTRQKNESGLYLAFSRQDVSPKTQLRLVDALNIMMSMGSVRTKVNRRIVLISLCLFGLFGANLNALAKIPDGTIESEGEYQLPVFETSGFHQSPEMKKYYENDIKQKLDTAKLTTDMRQIEYSSDGLKVQGLILTPKGVASNAKLPIVIWNRSGNADYNAIDVNDMIWLSRLAQKGYVILASQYRGTNGEKGKDDFGGKDVDDVLNLVKVAKALPQADSKNIFMAGHSRGGMETYLALKADPEFKAAATLAGECDLAAGLKVRSDMEKDVYIPLIPHYRREKGRELKARSACSWPTKIHTPLYLLQGVDDEAVDPQQAQEFAKKLRSAGKTVKVDMLPGTHNLWFMDENVDDTMNRLDQWFRTYYQPPVTVTAQVSAIQKQLSAVQGALVAPHQKEIQIQSITSKDGAPTGGSSDSSNDKKTEVDAGHPL
jgi:dienelactone hydrolase